MKNRKNINSPTIFSRVLAGILGGASGAALYASLLVSRAHRSVGTVYSSETITWYVLGGVLFGLLGGWTFAKSLWNWAIDDLLGEIESTSASILFFVTLMVLIFVAVKYFFFPS